MSNCALILIILINTNFLVLLYRKKKRTCKDQCEANYHKNVKITTFWLSMVRLQRFQILYQYYEHRDARKMPLSKDNSSADSDISDIALFKWGSDFLKLLWFQKYFILTSLQIQLEFPYTTFLLPKALGNTKTG